MSSGDKRTISRDRGGHRETTPPVGETLKQKKRARELEQRGGKPPTEFADFLNGAQYNYHVSFAYGLHEDLKWEDEPELLATWLQDHLFLESLDMRGVPNLTDKLLKHIGQGVGQNRSITVLNFTNNNLGPRTGLAEFLGNVEQNVSIWRLDLQRNGLDARAIPPLVKFIHENVGVTYLNLGHNPELGEDGCRQLCAALKENGSIYMLNLAGSNPDEETLFEVGRLCRRNRAAVAYKMAQEPPDQNREDEEPEEGLIGEIPEGEDSEKEEGEEAEEEEEEDDAEFESVLPEGNEKFAGAKAKEKKQKRNIDFNSLTELHKLLSKETIHILVDQKKREQERLDEFTFFEFLAEYLESLEIDKYKFETADAKANANILRDAAEFKQREKQHTHKIKDLEGTVFDISKDLLILQKTLELKMNENTFLTRKIADLESLLAQEEKMFTDQCSSLEESVKAIEEEKKEHELKTGIVQKDLDMIKLENNRLREHIRKFQNDISEIFYF